MSKKTQHVVPNKDGSWYIKKGGSLRATKAYDTKKEAITDAVRISKNQGAELYIHRRDGTIMKKNSYAADPCPPKDKK